MDLRRLIKVPTASTSLSPQRKRSERSRSPFKVYSKQL